MPHCALAGWRREVCGIHCERFVLGGACYRKTNLPGSRSWKGVLQHTIDLHLASLPIRTQMQTCDPDSRSEQKLDGRKNAAVVIGVAGCKIHHLVAMRGLRQHNSINPC